MYLKQLCCGVEMKESRTKFLKNKTGTLLVCPKCQTYWRMYNHQGKLAFERLQEDEIEDSNVLRKKTEVFRTYLIQNGWRPKNSINGVIWVHPEITPNTSGSYDFDSALAFQFLLDQTREMLKTE